MERRNVKHIKKIPHRYPLTPPSFEDWVLFDQQVATDDEFHARHGSNSRQKSFESLTYRLSSLPDGHVIKPKAATLSTHPTRQNDGNFKCLEHMSSRNCTAECLKAKPMADMKRPPPAPRPPRHPTPDLSDLDVEEIFPPLDNDKSKDSLWDCGSIDDELGKPQNLPPQRVLVQRKLTPIFRGEACKSKKLAEAVRDKIERIPLLNDSMMRR